MDKITLQKILHFIVAIAILVGAYLSINANNRLRQLQEERSDLHDTVRPLEVDDPNKIHVVALNPKLDSSGIDRGLVAVWSFRVYIPANCKVSHVSRYGMISADSPRAAATGSSSSHPGASKEPVEDLVTLSLEKTDKGWRVNRISNSGSGSSNLRSDGTIKDLEDLVIEPAIDAEDYAKSFAVDEPICMLRVRSKTAAQPKKGESATPLYNGFYFYLVPDKGKSKFEQQVSGS